MNPTNKIKLAIAALALVSAGANADVLYFQDFDGGTMGTVSNSPYTVASTVNGSANNNWRVHNGNGTNADAKPGSYTAATGNMVGHSRFYSDKEKSIFTFSVDATGFNNLSLMFDWGAILRDTSYDGVSLIAYTGTLNTSTTGAPTGDYTLLTDSTGGLAYSNNTGGYLAGAQYGNPDYGTVTGYNGEGSPYSEGGTAMFDVSGAGFSNEVVNFRLAFGSSNSNNSDGINFDNFKVTGDCIPGTPGCGPMGGTTPEPGTLTLAELGMAAAYRSRKRKTA